MTTELGFQQLQVSEKLVAAIVFVVLAAAWRFFTRRSKARLPPGPFAWPIIGNLHIMGGLPHRTLTAVSLKYGPLMSLRLGSSLALVVSSAEVAKEILRTHDHLFANKGQSAAQKHLTFNLSNIAFSSYSLHWKQMRKFFTTELLTSSRIDYFRFVREDSVSSMIRSIINSDDSGPVNISQTVSSLSRTIIWRMAFGKTYSDQDFREFGSMVRESFMLLGSFNIGDYIPYLDWLDLQGINSRMRKLHKAQDKLLEKVINEHVARKDPNVTHDLVDDLLAAAADKDRDFQISRDTIKGVLFVS